MKFYIVEPLNMVFLKLLGASCILTFNCIDSTSQGSNPKSTLPFGYYIYINASALIHRQRIALLAEVLCLMKPTILIFSCLLYLNVSHTPFTHINSVNQFPLHQLNLKHLVPYRLPSLIPLLKNHSQLLPSKSRTFTTFRPFTIFNTWSNPPHDDMVPRQDHIPKV